jgi:hypothetical protein
MVEMEAELRESVSKWGEKSLQRRRDRNRFDPFEALQSLSGKFFFLFFFLGLQLCLIAKRAAMFYYVFGRKAAAILDRK